MADTFPANANILLLISDPLMRTILHETLERAGYLVVSAGDVGSAVDRVKELRPDLLIIRPYVASMPGHMAAHLLRDRRPGLPVLIVTGFMDDERVRDQHELKEFFMFPKPFTKDEFLANVKEVLRISHEKGAEFAGLIALLFNSAPLCLAQSIRPEDLAQGSILIMQREVPDPIFSHSVIVLAHYDNTGALGLMIHYRSNVTIRRALPGIEGAEKRTETLFVGGPVEMEGVTALLRSTTAPANASHVAGKLYLITSKQGLATVLSEGRKESDLRVFLGYAGWGPGQLAREVRMGGWYIFNYDESLVFDEHPDTLWKRLIEKTELLKVLFPAVGARRKASSQ